MAPLPVSPVSKVPPKTLRTGPVNQARPNPLAGGPPHNLTVTSGTTQPRSTARGRSGDEPRCSPTPRSHTRNPKTASFRVGGEPQVHPIRETGIEFHPRPDLTYRNRNRGHPQTVNDPSPANTSPAANTPLPPKRKKRHFPTRTGHPTCCQQRATPLMVSPPPRPRGKVAGGAGQPSPAPPKSTRIRPPRNLTVTGETEQPRAASTARRRSGAATPGLPHPPLPHRNQKPPASGSATANPTFTQSGKTRSNSTPGPPPPPPPKPPAPHSPLKRKNAIHKPAPAIQPPSSATHGNTSGQTITKTRARHYGQGRSANLRPIQTHLPGNRPATLPSPAEQPSRGPRPAAAPAPQARVSPTPRSHTRNRKPPASGSATANPTFTRSGKRDLIPPQVRPHPPETKSVSPANVNEQPPATLHPPHPTLP